MIIHVFFIKFRWSVFLVIHLTIFIITGSFNCLGLIRIGHMPFPEPLNWLWSTSLMKIDLHYLASMIKLWIPHTLCNANSLLCLNVSRWFKLVSIVTIFNPSVHSRGKRYLINDFGDHTTGGTVCLRSQTHLLHEGSVTWKIMTSSSFLSVFG